jgi:hypothetical protein
MWGGGGGMVLNATYNNISVILSVAQKIYAIENK